MNITEYWNAVARQDADTLRTYFQPDAVIRWHNTNEQFVLEEFIRANCEYPGTWDAAIQKAEEYGDGMITAVHVWSEELSVSFHVVSFIRIREDRIAEMDEYWGDDGQAPQWRLDKHIGVPIGHSLPFPNRLDSEM